MAPTLVLLHGFTHTGASWRRVRAGLGEERYTSLAPDIRGHGAAGQRQPVDLEHVVEDVAGLTRTSFDLAGYSMGGRIALHVALALGPRVGRLVLIGASPGLAEPGEREARREADERLAQRVEKMTIEQFAGGWARTPVLAGLAPEVSAEIHSERLRNSVDGLARALRGLGTGALPPLWDRLAELRIPVSLIVGERDEKFRELADHMAQRLPQATTVVVPGAGHAVHLEAPQRVADIIKRSPEPGQLA